MSVTLDDLTHGERRTVGEWCQSQAGGMRRDFLPRAIRRMPVETMLRLSGDEGLTRLWQARERSRIEQSFPYMVESYGVLQPPRGKPVPFDPWPCQRPVLHALATEPALVLPKARRMGISWATMHLVLWTCSLGPDASHARALILSKGLDDAKEMLKRVKFAHEHLPEFLRAAVMGDTDNTQEVSYGQASVKSLPATSGAARSETATLVVCDEFAFVRNRQAEGIRIAVEPTIEGGGRIVYCSSGNGEVGDGAEFARLCRTAQRGEDGAPAMIFLPASERPDRSSSWLDERREQGLIAEYAETLDEALAGDRTIHIYEPSWIEAAVRLGSDIEASPSMMKELLEQGFEWGTDWGDFQTVTVYALGLPGGGLFIVDELFQAHVEPQQASEAIVMHDPGGYRHRDGGKLPAIRSNQDASPAGTNATYASVLRRLRGEPALRHRLPETAVRIPFGEFKQGGGDRGKANTVGFLRWLFQRSAEHVAAERPPTEAHGVIALAPRTTLLARQLRNLERDPETGKVRKPSLDPKRPELGDHGPDGLVALAAVPRAVEWTAQHAHLIEAE